jgi:hypothetical protein
MRVMIHTRCSTYDKCVLINTVPERSPRKRLHLQRQRTYDWLVMRDHMCA